MKRYLIFFIVIFILIGEVFKANPEKRKYWIFFDKKKNFYLGKRNINDARIFLSEKAIKRRQKVKGNLDIIDGTDLPVNGEYITYLSKMGIKVLNVSK